MHPKARPMPVNIKDISRIAISRGSGLIVLNPQSDTVQYLGRSAVAALAAETQWIAPWEDHQIVTEILHGIEAANFGKQSSEILQHITVHSSANGICVLNLMISKNTKREAAVQLVRTVLVIIQKTAYLRARLDALEIRPVFA
ncbi:hypothetical protein RQN30_12370 [Arcanobacterium hippocoleae]